MKLNTRKKARELRARHGKAECLRRSLALLTGVELNRVRYAAATSRAFMEHGDGNGTLIAGVLRDHFPDTTKNTLRTYAHSIGACADWSALYWRAAGRHHSTWLPKYRNVPSHGSRY
jgi:hypothetical protein